MDSRPYVRPSVRPSVRTLFISEKSALQIFLIFLMKLWLCNYKKVTVSLFGRKFKIGPFLAKHGPKLAIFGQYSPNSVFFGLEDTRRPMDSRSSVRTSVHAFVRPSVRTSVHPSSVSEKSAHEIFLIFFMKPWLYKR